MAQLHLEQVLTATGLPADQVKALVELPADAPDFKTDGYVAPIRSTVETQVKNDPKFYEGLNKDNLPKEFLKTLETEQYGRSAAQVRTNMMKALGLKEEDFKDLGEDGKKIDVFGPAFAKKIAEGKVGDKELQAKLIEANKQLEEINGKIPEIETRFKTEYETKIADFQFSNTVISTLATVAGLKAPAKFLAGEITSQLKGKYGFEVVGGVVELRQKDKPTLKVMNEKGTAELTLSDAIKNILEKDELITKKTTTTTTTKVDVNTENGGGFKINSHVNDRINQRIAEDAKNAG